MENTTTTSCDVDPQTLKALRKFRFRKEHNIAAYIVQIDGEKLLVHDDVVLEGTTLEEIAEHLPETLPRYIVLSYMFERSDGRVSYPLLLLYYNPEGSNPRINMLYASALIDFQAKIDISKAYDFREAEELTKEWLESKLFL